MSWVDLLVIDKDCTGQCLKDATAFIHYLNSEPTLISQLTGWPPRYLMPARASVYQNKDVIKAAPLYAVMRPILERAATPTDRHLGQDLRDYGHMLDKDLPAPAAK